MNIRTLTIATAMACICVPAIIPTSLAAPPPSGQQKITNYGKNALTEIPEDAKRFLFAPPKDLKWFQDAKFGIFICWGPCSLKEAEIGWGRRGRRPGWKQQPKQGVPEEEYDNLYKQFNPVDFNADKWVEMIKDSGAKYMIFLTKHHDGFCMFDAKNSDYKITNTPYGKDVAKALADACHKYGIKIFWYYSQPDWHHPDFLTENHDQYRKYLYEHIRQLLTDYGKIDGVWFDCLNTSWRHWNTPALVKMIRELQPGIIVNNRWGWGMPGMKNNGDFDTPEQKIGMFKIKRPWETCATMGQGWSWRGGGKLMSADECVLMLVRCVGAGGNLALDCGPQPDGTIYPQAKQNYLAMGKWLKTHGESIYATRAGPYKPGLYGVSTRKNNKIFLHILAEYPKNSIPTISLPMNFGDAKPTRVSELTSGKQIPFKIKNGELKLNMREITQNTPDTVIVLDLDSSAMDIPVIDMSPDKLLAQLKSVSASSYYNKRMKPQNVVSNKNWTFEAGIHAKYVWVAKPTVKPHWFQLDFKQSEKIAALTIAEPRGRLNTKKFNLQYMADGKWTTFFEGTTIGSNKHIIFKPIETSKIRLNFLEIKKSAPALEKFNAYKQNTEK